MSRLRMPIGRVEVASVGSVDEPDATSVLAGLPKTTLVESSLCDRVTCGTHSPGKARFPVANDGGRPPSCHGQRPAARDPLVCHSGLVLLTVLATAAIV